MLSLLTAPGVVQSEDDVGCRETEMIINRMHEDGPRSGSSFAIMMTTVALASAILKGNKNAR
jgi:hypothetical protein